MSKLTKAARGQQLGDVANCAVRNHLTLLSDYGPFHKITEAELIETEEFLDYRCPYTGRDLRYSIENHLDDVVIDHIVPQNRKYCGLNVKGNLVYVDRAANAKKSSKCYEDFILKNTEVISGTAEERMARVERIKQLQLFSGYDPEALAKILRPELERIYIEVQDNQNRYFSGICNLIYDNIVNP